MNKVEEILQSFRNQFVGGEERERIANERLDICKQCPLFTHKLLGISICDKCKCTLAKDDKPFGKPYSPVNSCPLKKWNS